MQYYDTIELMPHTASYYDHHSGEMRHLSYATLAYQSLKEAEKKNMNPLTRAEIFRHQIGRAMVGIWSPPRDFEKRKVLAYAGITGFEDYQGKRVATIGGLLVLPSARNNGFGSEVVEAVVVAAEAQEAISEYAHEGLLARCNGDSRGIFTDLGFKEVDLQDNKSVMLKEIA